MSADDCAIPQIRLSAGQGNINCLMLSPMAMVGLGLGGALNGSHDGTGMTCKGTDRQTGQESEISVFQGHPARETDLNDISMTGQIKSGLVRLIKVNTPGLAEISYLAIDGLVAPNQQTCRIFDNMRMAVATCGSPSRYYNRCYLSGRDYSDADAEKLTGQLFSGAKSVYGDRFYLVSLQYSAGLEPIFPVADIYFNIINKLVSLALAAPGLVRISNDREYVKCQVRRTSGRVQTGFIQLGRYSMLIYKSRAEDGPGLSPHITVYFNSNGSDILDGDIEVQDDLSAVGTTKIPEHDCFKTIRLMDLFTENPGFKDYFLNDLGFENLCLRGLHELIKDEQQ
jgi:hypothetical protein